MLSIGPHMSIGKGYDRAIKDALTIGASTMQVFTRNPRGGKARQVPDDEFERARTLAHDNNFGPIVLHAPYTINLASSRDDVREFGHDTIREDFSRVTALNATGLVVHAGAHTGAGESVGERRLRYELERLLPHVPAGSRLLIETMSGSGSELGHTLDALAQLLRDIDAPEALGICLDTCHLFAAGYDIRDWATTRRIIHDTIDWTWIGACHLNDSKTPLASNRDRHDVLGSGHIGWNAFGAMMRDPDIQKLPLILETPQPDLAGWGKEISELRRLAAE